MGYRQATEQDTSPGSLHRLGVPQYTANTLRNLRSAWTQHAVTLQSQGEGAVVRVRRGFIT